MNGSGSYKKVQIRPDPQHYNKCERGSGEAFQECMPTSENLDQNIKKSFS